MVSGQARIAGVLGWPVAHSLSPRLHGVWLAKYGIDGAYIPLPVRPEDVVEALRMLPKMGFRGANVTVPHKEAACRAVDRRTDRAHRIGAVNTVIVEEDGALLGDNTDGYGFLENLRQGAPAWSAAAGRAVVLGAGGAARGVVAALIDAGVPEVVVLNRTAERARRLAAEMGPAVTGDVLDAAPDWLGDCHLLVNTTSVGMAGGTASAGGTIVDLEMLAAGAIVNDIVYTPLVTPFLEAARRTGHHVVDGLGMLLHQARPGFKAWFGVAPEVDEDLRVRMLSVLEERSR
jgi:shikimate dehydrogenase